MTKRFLNIIYGDRRTKIEVTGFERIAQLRKAVKEEFGDDIPAPAARIQLCNQQGALIDDLDDIGEEYYQKVKKGEGGTCLVVGTLPAPPLRYQHGHAEGMSYEVSALYIFT